MTKLVLLEHYRPDLLEVQVKKRSEGKINQSVDNRDVAFIANDLYRRVGRVILVMAICGGNSGEEPFCCVHG